MSRSGCSKPIVGVTGSICAGKSVVSGIFRDSGCAVIDSDQLAHEELAAAEVLQQLRTRWGEGVCRDGVPDRKAIGAIVFSDSAALKLLEELLYPRIERRRRALVAEYEKDESVRAIICDAPKLFEAGLDASCDFVVVVDAPFGVRLERALRVRGWSEAELARREKMLEPLEQKKAKADYVVTNQSGIDKLRSEVERIFDSILSAFAAR